jgi:hypothetical protein
LVRFDANKKNNPAMPSLSSLFHHFIASHPGDGIFMLSLVNNIYPFWA